MFLGWRVGLEGIYIFVGGVFSFACGGSMPGGVLSVPGVEVCGGLGGRGGVFG